jgi:hypothetical protein
MASVLDNTEGKIFPMHARKAWRGVEVHLRALLTSARYEDGQLRVPASLPQGKEPTTLTEQEAGEPHSRSRRFRREKNLLPASRIELSASQYTDCTILTSLAAQQVTRADIHTSKFRKIQAFVSRYFTITTKQ